MTPHIRKLLSPGNYSTTPISLLNPSTNTTSSSSFLRIEERENPSNYNGATEPCCFNYFKLSPPFDSAMALSVIVLLTALLFMGFFSIYLRRFSGESSGDNPRRRQGRGGSPAPSHLTTVDKGVDPTVVRSLPVKAYICGDTKQGIQMKMECAICLSEFEEREWVKEIPYCEHVFHVECIDTWLSSHVTCPLCRTAKLLPSEEKEERERKVVGHVAVVEEGLIIGGGVQEEVENGGRELD